MNIQEAVKTILDINEEDRGNYCLHRSIPGWNGTYIYPTNSSDCCYLLNVEKQKKMIIEAGRRWDPTAEDLMANNWELFELK